MRKTYMGQTEPGGSDELALIEQAAHGDHEAFRSLVLSYENKLLAYLTQMIGDVDNARDIAQETFIAVFHALPRWKPQSKAIDQENTAHPLAPWLYRIATNRALTHIRKQDVRKRVHSPEWQQKPEPMKEIEHPEASFEERYVISELLREALSKLADEDAMCLILYYVSGERYGEIASRLGLTGEAVRKRVSRALITLRKTYFALDAEVRS